MAGRADRQPDRRLDGAETVPPLDHRVDAAAARSGRDLEKDQLVARPMEHLEVGDAVDQSQRGDDLPVELDDAIVPVTARYEVAAGGPAGRVAPVGRDSARPRRR